MKSLKFDPFSLEGKRILITGSSSGIGRQCAISCSNSGAAVSLFGRNMQRLEETLCLMDSPERHVIVSTDLTDDEKLEEIVKDLVTQGGAYDGIIHCAGVSTTLPANMNKKKKLNEFFNINVGSPLNLTRIITKPSSFSSAGGSVIFIASVMGVVGENGKSLYSMTKGALISAARSLAIELAPKKIRVNCISPGVVDTPMSQNAVYSSNEDSMKKMINLHPLGLGEPEDIANACIYLISDASKWVTGTNMIVDGGYTAK